MFSIKHFNMVIFRTGCLSITYIFAQFKQFTVMLVPTLCSSKNGRIKKNPTPFKSPINFSLTFCAPSCQDVDKLKFEEKSSVWRDM